MEPTNLGMRIDSTDQNISYNAQDNYTWLSENTNPTCDKPKARRRRPWGEASVFAKQKQVSEANPLPKAIANKSFQRKDWVNFVKGWGKERSGYKTWLGNEASKKWDARRVGYNPKFSRDRLDQSDWIMEWTMCKVGVKEERV